jgi:iron complex outermembrane receptor protein
MATGQSNPGNPIRDFDQSSSFLQFQWRRALSLDSDFVLRYAYSVDKGSEAFVNPNGGSPYRYDPWGAEGSRHEIEALHNLRLGEAVRLAWGGSWRQDAVRAQTTLAGQGEVRRDISRLFGNLEWKPAAWLTANLGLSGEEDTLAGAHVAPRASLAFHLNPRNTLRVGASRAYRTGSTVDYRGDWWNGAKYQFRGDPDMPSERMDTLEIGYLGDWRDWRMSLDVRLFDEKVHNRLLVIDRNDADNTIPDAMTAIQDVRMRGIEYQWRWQPIDSTKLVLSQMFIDIDAGYLASALANPNNSLHSAQKFSHIDELSEYGTPHRSTSLLLIQKLPYGLEFSAAGYWQSNMKWSINTAALKYHRVDTKLAYPFRVAGMGGELAWTIQSLNGAHFEYKAYNVPADRIVERRQWISLRLDF